MPNQTYVLQEKDEFVDNIKEDIKAMGLQHEPITYTSDYFGDLRVLCLPLSNSWLAHRAQDPCDNHTAGLHALP
jgi:glutamyl/glutaminyl-tRNA synthetase